MNGVFVQDETHLNKDIIITVLYLVRNQVNHFLLKTSIIEHFQQGDKKEKRLGIQFITHKMTEEMGKSNQLHVLRRGSQGHGLGAVYSVSNDSGR